MPPVPPCLPNLFPWPFCPVRQRINMALANYTTALDLSWLDGEGGQCLPPRERQGQVERHGAQRGQVRGRLLLVPVSLLPSPPPPPGLRCHGRSLALAQASESWALTSAEKLLDLAQMGLLRGQHEGQDDAWVVGTRRPARRDGPARVSGYVSCSVPSVQVPSPPHPSSPTCRPDVCRPRGWGGDQS